MLSVFDTPNATVTDRRDAIATVRTEAAPCGMSTAAIRHALRALASEMKAGETSGQTGLREVRRLRPMVTQAHDALRERLEAGGSVEDYLRGRARLADSAVVGLLHVAAISTGLLQGSMVAPLAAVATGGYGRRELAPGSDLDVLFLLPEGSPSGTASAMADCVSAVVAGLWDLGFVLDHAARSSRECIELAHSEPAVLATLLDRRFLWGGYGLFAGLDGDLAALFSGPDAGRWRDAVRSAMTQDGTRIPENEPDVKRGPGGLRDLQRALSANALASGRPTTLATPTLVEAHRFLWLVRCHLHLLVGRAEDRLRSALQYAVARRLGVDDPRGASPASRLLHLFRHHARNVLEAGALATDSGSARPR